MTLNCIHIFIVTGSYLYWCVMRLASQRFFIHSCIYLRIWIISYLVTFLGTYSLSVLKCRKAVNQSTVRGGSRGPPILVPPFPFSLSLLYHCYFFILLPFSDTTNPPPLTYLPAPGKKSSTEWHHIKWLAIGKKSWIRHWVTSRFSDLE